MDRHGVGRRPLPRTTPRRGRPVGPGRHRPPRPRPRLRAAPGARGGVLHRDIKPGNVLVERRDRRVVLTDFGIAAIQDAKALTMVGMLVGSPDYMAPERVSGRHQGPPSDVWSLGATLCAALGGRSPFSRETTLATLHAVLYEDPELPATAGPLRDILAALLEKEPSARPALEDVEQALRPVAFPDPDPEPDPEPKSHEAPEIRNGRPETAPPTSVAAHEDTPTPAYLDASLVRAARQPREQPPEEPERDQQEPEPPSPTDAVPAARTAATPVLGTPSPRPPTPPPKSPPRYGPRSARRSLPVAPASPCSEDTRRHRHKYRHRR